MPYYTVYIPVVNPGDGSCWFTVNGAPDRDKEEAISKTRRHCAFRTYNGVKPTATIARIDEREEWEYS